MKTFKAKTLILAALLCQMSLLVSCDKAEMPDDGVKDPLPAILSLDDIARVLSELPVGPGQMGEVKDAVDGSLSNGYDEEYMLCDLLGSPGAPVGGAVETKAATYDVPIRDLLKEYLEERYALTKAGEPDSVTAQAYLGALEASDVQIYWPYSENWDGTSMPVITFDPCDGSKANIGFRRTSLPGGGTAVETVTVDEDYAREHPVWVVNRNDDASFTTIEMLRRQDPSWGQGGEIVIGTRAGTGRTPAAPVPAGPDTRADGDDEAKTLILKSFKTNKNYDPWFSGASEFFVKCGSIEKFKAATDEELKKYSPEVTDFMVTVRRSQVGQSLPFNAILVSEWTDQLQTCAFLVTEDDGGTRTTWNCTVEAKLKSKTTGLQVSIPFNTHDDIVWRGMLTRSFFERYNGKTGYFGDVEIVFELL